MANRPPVSHMPVGKPIAVNVDPADNPILIKDIPPQRDPVPRTPVSAPTRVPPTGGGRSGVGRLQKAGFAQPGIPSTSGGYDSSGINPSAGRPRVPSTGGTLPPRQRPTPKTGGALPPKQRPAGSIREHMMSKLGKLPGRGRRYDP